MRTQPLHDFLLIGGQEPMESRLRDNSNVFKGIPPYFTPYGRDFIAASRKGYSFPAYAIAALSAVLKDSGFSVSCVNDFYSEPESETAKKIKSTRLAVCISTTFLTKMDSIKRIIRFVRSAKPGARIVMGGAGIINFPGSRRDADINVFYEAEETMRELARFISAKGGLSGVAGISYRVRGEEVFTPERAVIGDLGKTPIPDWGAVSEKVREERYLPIESSRGCVGSCLFCLETRYWPGVRFYPVERVMRELKTNIGKFGVRHYYFQDSNISNNPGYLADLCDSMRSAGLGITWSCESRIDTVTKGLVDKMRAAGCRAITFGMESADGRILRNMNKPMSRKKMKAFLAVVRRMRRSGMMANINVMVGFPGEDRISVRRTVDFLREAQPVAYSMSKFFLEKGTGIWNSRKSFGLKGSMYRWRHDTMCSKELDDIVRDIFLAVSADLRIFHWASASVDLVRHMSKGKSFDDFLGYIKSVNQICLEDLTRKGERYSARYDSSYRHIAGYLS